MLHAVVPPSHHIVASHPEFDHAGQKQQSTVSKGDDRTDLLIEDEEDKIDESLHR
jgi:hypothetical protein